MTISVSGPQLWPSGAHMAPPQHPHSAYTAITQITTAPGPIFLARSWGRMPLRGYRDALCHSSRRCRLGSRPRMADPVWALGDACHGGACALPMIWDASRANSLHNFPAYCCAPIYRNTGQVKTRKCQGRPSHKTEEVEIDHVENPKGVWKSSKSENREVEIDPARKPRSKNRPNQKPEK